MPKLFFFFFFCCETQLFRLEREYYFIHMTVIILPIFVYFLEYMESYLDNSFTFECWPSNVKLFLVCRHNTIFYRASQKIAQLCQITAFLRQIDISISAN